MPRSRAASTFFKSDRLGETPHLYWHGSGVAGCFLRVVIDPKTLTGAGAAEGGALGGAIEGLHATQKKRGKKKYLLQDVLFVDEMDLSGLAFFRGCGTIRNGPSLWEERSVIVIPRKAVQFLRKRTVGGWAASRRQWRESPSKTANSSIFRRSCRKWRWRIWWIWVREGAGLVIAASFAVASVRVIDRRLDRDQLKHHFPQPSSDDSPRRFAL